MFGGSEKVNSELCYACPNQFITDRIYYKFPKPSLILNLKLSISAYALPFTLLSLSMVLYFFFCYSFLILLLLCFIINCNCITASFKLSMYLEHLELCTYLVSIFISRWLKNCFFFSLFPLYSICVRNISSDYNSNVVKYSMI